MAIKSEWIQYGDQKGYFAFPERATEALPSIIVIQEAWGVDGHIEDLTRRFAAAGYAALAPDLFSVDGVRPAALTQERIDKAIKFIRQFPPTVWMDVAARENELSKLPEQDHREINESIGQLFGGSSRMAEYIDQLKKAVRHLKTVQPETRDQKVGCVGFCMGGGLSALLACEEPYISGAAVFYGNTPPADKIPAMGCPVIGFYGANDQRINQGIPAFEKALSDGGRAYEHFIYKDANHSFFNDGGQAYNVRAVRDSTVRLLSFFQKTLSE